jgi:glycosyltransferase involved in cell wall biosynthesis
MLHDMTEQSKTRLSIVVPVYNEASGLVHFHDALVTTLRDEDLYNNSEIIYCDDGSQDDSQLILDAIAKKDAHVKTIVFSRNFGKESALTAGITQASGDAILTIDADEQHPIELIPKFVDLWKNGAKVVVGVHQKSAGTRFKSIQSKLFYSFFNKISGQKLVPGSTDYRLIDKSVRGPFIQLAESNRMTRALIDWLGFKQQYVSFTPNKRQHGTASYGQAKLIRLAMDSVVSLSPRPLYFLGYLGIAVTGFEFVLGAVVLIELVIFIGGLRERRCSVCLCCFSLELFSSHRVY